LITAFFWTNAGARNRLFCDCIGFWYDWIRRESVDALSFEEIYMQIWKKVSLRRNAFTLVELLVVIAIIGILMGLLIPAANMVRESARRANCSSRQRQIALAMQAYHSNKQKFPRLAVGIYDNASGEVPNTTWAWSTYLLPYLEGQNVYDILDPLQNNPANIETIAAARPEFRQALQTTLPVFRCPSDDAPDLNSQRVLPNGLEVATSNFIGSNSAGPGFTAGDGTAPWFYMDEPDPGSGGTNTVAFGTTYGTSKTNGVDSTIEGKGVFCTMRSSETVSGVRDGQSNTLAIGERSWEYGPASNLQLSRAALSYVGRPNVAYGYQVTLGSGDMGGSAGRGLGFLYSHNSPNGMDGYSSEHPAGSNFSFIDGSVRFIADDINIVTFWRLAHRKDNLLLGEY